MKHGNSLSAVNKTLSKRFSTQAVPAREKKDLKLSVIQFGWTSNIHLFDTLKRVVICVVSSSWLQL